MLLAETVTLGRFTDRRAYKTRPGISAEVGRHYFFPTDPFLAIAPFIAFKYL